MFCDRNVLIKEDSPNGEWSLHVYGPSHADPSRRAPGDPPFYASFMKYAKGTVTAVPFGYPTDPSQVRVVWHDSGKKVCQIFIGDDCYAMFMWGTWRFHRRGFFRQTPEPPFTEAEYKVMEEKGYLEEE